MAVAKLYRMVAPVHLCPYGLRSRDLLRRKGFDIEDHPLATREEAESLKERLGVETTPQVFIDGKRIGGYDSLREYFRLPPLQREGISYQPVVAVFILALLLSLVLQVRAEALSVAQLLMDFVGFSMSILALLKLRDLHSFTNQFITYDLLAMRRVRYAYFYPFAEAWVGIMMLSAAPPVVYAPLALFIGVVGAVSVIKAVYIEKRELKCACVGGNSRVPLGFVSLTENLVMAAAGGVMLCVS